MRPYTERHQQVGRHERVSYIRRRGRPVRRKTRVSMVTGHQRRAATTFVHGRHVASVVYVYALAFAVPYELAPCRRGNRVRADLCVCACVSRISRIKERAFRRRP